MPHAVHCYEIKIKYLWNYNMMCGDEKNRTSSNVNFVTEVKCKYLMTIKEMGDGMGTANETWCKSIGISKNST